MNKYLILANNDKDIDLSLSRKIVEYIEKKGACADIVSDVDNHYNGIYIKDEYVRDAKAVIVLGGDGTMLRAASGIGSYDVALMGVNLGTLGFLTEVEVSNVYGAIDRLLSGDYEIEERMMIEGTFNADTYQALNDVVVTRAGFSRIIGLNIYVNGELLDTYEADGVIVATPTGSTGYSLSAGGPLVSPKTNAIVVTPISPHSLTSKSVVYDENDEIRIEIVKKRKTQNTEAIASFDGSNNTPLSAGDVITIKKSNRKIKLIRLYPFNFYRVLRDKIGG
ncbi:MAG: NAD(+)/NADH kinase [Lachnospiraceae bacterium]|nr:NAD(+)/NADH kinase [Lachnospiraceae bacterium]